MNESKITAAIPILPSADVRASIDFYVSKLGFSECFSHGEPPDYAGIERDGAAVHLCCMDDAKNIAAQTTLRFAVQNVTALYNEIKESGALHPNGALQTKPWGTLEFTVLDLDGVCVTFFESN